MNRMLEAKLGKLSPEARVMFDEIEERSAAKPGISPEELLSDVPDRIVALPESERHLFLEVMEQRLHEREQVDKRLRAEGADWRHIIRLMERASELAGAEADDMTLERAMSVLASHGEPFPVDLFERMVSMLCEPPMMAGDGR